MWLCHFPEVPAPLVAVAYWGKTGRHLLAMSSSQFDPTRTSGHRVSVQTICGALSLIDRARRLTSAPARALRRALFPGRRSSPAWR